VAETALVVTVPEAEPLVGEWRARYDWSARRGVPAHITLLYPFVPTDRVDDGVLQELEALFGDRPAFSITLPRVARFDEVAWLAPEPSEPFAELTRLIAGRFPDYPPYGGIHAEVIPHLTVAEGGADLQDEVEAALTPHLPISAPVNDVAFLFEGADGLWREAHRFPLAG
jgi:hypothetical protein